MLTGYNRIIVTNIESGFHMFKILVVEDEKDISAIIGMYLNQEGFEYTLVDNGFAALEAFMNQSFQMIILDVMMPGIDGFEVLRRIREVSDVPVIMLTAKQEEIDRLNGFELGADDYVVKPFSPKELVKRVKVFKKRVYKESDETLLIHGPFSLHVQSMRLFKVDTQISITTTEFRLLYAFFRNLNQVLTREQIIEQAFGMGYDGIDRNIDTYIKRLRKKIEENPKYPKYLKTKYGQGYVFGGDE